MKKYHDLEKKEVLRYAGYRQKQELTPEMVNLTESMMAEGEKSAQPRYVFQFFDLAPAESGSEANPLPQLAVSGTPLILAGKGIARHLKGATKVCLLAVTLGIEIEKKIKLFEYREMAKAILLDAVATELVEKTCDFAECEIQQAAEALGLVCNSRFSPGYGDLPLDIQPTFLAVLDTQRKLGLACSDTLLMIPRKSVTAIIGLFPEDAKRPRRKKRENCDECNRQKDCPYRKEEK